MIQGFKVKRVDQEKYCDLIRSQGDDLQEHQSQEAESHPRYTRTEKIHQRPHTDENWRCQVSKHDDPIHGAHGTVWCSLDKDQIHELEMMMAMAIRKVLSLPKSTNYKAMLHEIHCIHME